MSAKPLDFVPVEHITRAILVLRGHQVLLDTELAALYGVATKALNQAVKRNSERFPEDFLFRLTRSETEALDRSRIVTGHQKRRDPRFPPYALTEHGALMAATILNGLRQRPRVPELPRAPEPLPVSARARCWSATLDRARTVQDSGGHEGTVLGQGVGRESRVTALLVTGPKPQSRSG